MRPDFLALNEIHIPAQTGRWLQRAARSHLDLAYSLVQQSKVGEDGGIQAEGLLTRYPPIETANLDYRSHDCVALVARFEFDRRLLDVYVTHLIAARVGESARQEQVEKLLAWIGRRDDTDAAVVCGKPHNVCRPRVIVAGPSEHAFCSRLRGPSPRRLRMTTT